MTVLPRAPRALLSMDAITILRPSASVDAEGESTGNRTTVLKGRGTLASLTGTEQLTAAQRGTRVDKALALTLDANVVEGDFVMVSLVTYEVVALEDRRLYRRALLRKVS